jgi:hypothetical protein
LSASIYKIADQDLTGSAAGCAWVLEGTDVGGVCFSSMTSGFADMLDALLPCIQQCLSQEPPLAIALSL